MSTREPMTFDQAIAATLKQLRYDRRITLREMGRRMGVHATYERVEAATQSARMSYLHRVAAELDVSVLSIVEDAERRLVEDQNVDAP